MKLSGYFCPHCGGVVFDTPSHCMWCSRQHEGILAMIVRAHHHAKLMLVGRCQSEEELTHCEGRLHAVAEALAFSVQEGMALTETVVNDSFAEILIEEE